MFNYMKYTAPLKKNRDFENIYKNGQSVACRYLVLYTCPNDGCRNRLGVSVSRKVGSAVVRNRLKRRVRESYRAVEAGVKRGYDFVVIARVSAGKLSVNAMYGKINQSLLFLLSKQNMT
jgi:ribonuclease P protein component